MGWFGFVGIEEGGDYWFFFFRVFLFCKWMCFLLWGEGLRVRISRADLIRWVCCNCLPVYLS